MTRCNKCKRLIKPSRLFNYKGELICKFCIIKLPQNRDLMSASIIKSRSNSSTMKEALEKEYMVSGYKCKGKNTIKSQINSVPTILIGHKVKLVLIK